MTEKTEDLIAEMRERAEHPATGSNVAQCLREGARALEEANARLAALSAPQEGDAREAIEAEATRRWGTFAATDTRQGAFERDAFVDGAVWMLSRAAAPEVEWEYGVKSLATGMVFMDWPEAKARDIVSRSKGTKILVRRRKAGQWEPVGGDDE